jgi:hypothetical protein
MIYVKLHITRDHNSGGCGLWYNLMPFATIFQLYIVAVSFIDGGNRFTQRKAPTCRKSLTASGNIYPKPGMSHYIPCLIAEYI